MAGSPRSFFALFSQFKNTGTIREFITAVEDMAYDLFRDDEDSRLKFKGDCLEILAEIFFKAHAYDSAIGLTDYHPIPLDEDYGVDAMARNPNGHKVAVQVKYRKNPKDSVEFGDLAKTFTTGLLKHGLDLHEEKTVYLFTTASGITNAADKVMESKLVIINRGIIAEKIDNNITFWEFAYKEIFDTLNVDPADD